MRITCEPNPRIAFTPDGRAEITFTCPGDAPRMIETLNGKAIDLDLTAHSERRSPTQNGYLWALIGQLSGKLGIAKEEIYRSYIRDYGEYEVIPVKKEASATFIKRWSAHGIGWMCEELRESRIDGYVNLIAYYGSSCYSRATMNPLLDAVIRDCEEQGIPTIGDGAKSLKNEN